MKGELLGGLTFQEIFMDNEITKPFGACSNSI